MSTEFKPLSWDELLADIPTVAENAAAEQLRKEAEKAKKSAKSTGNTAVKKEKAKKEAPAPGQGKPNAGPPSSSKKKPKAEHSPSRKEKSKTEPAVPKKESSKAADNPPKQEKQKDSRRKSKNDKQAVKKEEASQQTDERTKITLPPVIAPAVIYPIIDLAPKEEESVPEALVINLSAINHPVKEEDQEADADEMVEERRSTTAILFCALRRFLLTIFVMAGLVVVGLWLVLNLIFNGPSPTARDVLTMSLSEASGTKWVPGLFLDEKLVEEIRKGDTTLLAEDEASSDLPPIEINTDTSLTANSDEWKDCPDGIRIEKISGDTYNAYVMLVRNPSTVYLSTSSNHFDMTIPGKRITEQIEIEGAIAAVNAGAFFDNGTSDPSVGSIPQGLTISKGNVVWDSGKGPEQGFVGFNQDNVLVVADTMTAEEAQALGIRDGCSFGPVLIQNGAIKNDAYNSASGYNPRTAIGQRADGSVILLCIDGRQSQSIGGTYADIIDIMVEYGAVNACNLDGGSSTTMLYRDQDGRYGTAGQVHMINNYSLLQSQPRKMPTFIMVRPEGEE